MAFKPASPFEFGKCSEQNMSMEKLCSNIQWNNQKVKDYFQKLIEKYGFPSHISIQPGGMAIWKKEKIENLPFDSILIVDELFYSWKHGTEIFVTVNINFELIEQCRNNVLGNWSDTISYFPYKKILSCCGPNVDFCIVVLTVATTIGNNSKLSCDLVDRKSLVEKSFQLLKSDKNAVSQFLNRLRGNLENSLGNPIVIKKI